MTADYSDTPAVIAPPPLIALAAIALGLAFDWIWRINFLRDLCSLPVRLAIGGALIGAGGVLAIFAERTFRRIGTNAAPWKPALQLASTGLYAHTRNPMYLGLALFVLGVGVAMESAWTLAMLVPAALVPALRRGAARGALSRRKVRRGLSRLESARPALRLAQ